MEALPEQVLRKAINNKAIFYRKRYMEGEIFRQMRDKRHNIE